MNTGRRFCEVAARAFTCFVRIVVFSWFPGSWRNGGILLAGFPSFQNLPYRSLEYSVLSRMNVKTRLGYPRSVGSAPVFPVISAIFINLLLLSGRDKISKLLLCWLPDCMQEDRVHTPRYPILTSVLVCVYSRKYLNRSKGALTHKGWVKDLLYNNL